MSELEWVECKECIYFQEGDCEDFYTKCDGCYFGMTEQDILNEESAAADYNKNKYLIFYKKYYIIYK